MEYAIKFSNVTKSYRIGIDKSASLKDIIIRAVNMNKYSYEYKVVISNLNIAIPHGSTVAIIGKNGAGKSTLLKMVANVMKPDTGSVFVNGRVAALLEIGAGFQAELTGRENVYLYASILGLRKKEVDKKLSSILDFAEIGSYIDEPVKNYSSGMYMRLAFAVAIHVDPDILVIDEILAVGDEQFQKKCLKKIFQLKQGKKTILFVSHDLEMVKKLADIVLYIEDQDNYFYDTPVKMVNKYLEGLYKVDKKHEDTEESCTTKEVNFSEMNNRWGNNFIQIDKVKLRNSLNELTSVFYAGEPVIVDIFYRQNKMVGNFVVGIALYSEEGIHVAGPNSSKNSIYYVPEKSGLVTIEIDTEPLINKNYLLTVALYDEHCLTPYDHWEKCKSFKVINENATAYGLVNLKVKWT